MRVRIHTPLLIVALVSMAAPAAAQPRLSTDKPGYEFRLLATSMTHTMEMELNRAAEEGFRFQTAMGGETANGGNEVVVVMARRAGEKPRVSYKLLATSPSRGVYVLSAPPEGLTDRTEA